MTNAERQAAYRARQAALGRRARVYYLTDVEKRKLDAVIREMRASEADREV